jgi:hypothetical protein
MKRREFLGAMGAAAAALESHALAADAAGAGAPRQFYEWRTYRLADATKQSAVLEYLRGGAVPAWKRLGLGPIGVFTEIGPDAKPDVHVLLTYGDLGQLAALREAFEADAEQRAAAQTHMSGEPAAPVVSRIDAWLLKAFPCAPQATPPTAGERAERVYELRTYESYNADRARAKVNMFCGGEIPIFVKCGFAPVFFGETLVGSGQPHLKYMLAAPAMAANEAGWKQFVEHPDWLAMRDLPEYKDTVSKIEKLFLRSAEFSEV